MQGALEHMDVSTYSVNLPISSINRWKTRGLARKSSYKYLLMYTYTHIANILSVCVYTNIQEHFRYNIQISGKFTAYKTCNDCRAKAVIQCFLHELIKLYQSHRHTFQNFLHVCKFKRKNSYNSLLQKQIYT